MAAPSAAPEAVPRTYGSASGLRKSPWNAVPATDNPRPTTMASSTLGRRRSRTIVSAGGVHVWAIGRPRSRSARASCEYVAPAANRRTGRRDQCRRTVTRWIAIPSDWADMAAYGYADEVADGAGEPSPAEGDGEAAASTMSG